MKFSKEFGLPDDVISIIQCTDCKKYALDDNISKVSDNKWLCKDCLECYIVENTSIDDISEFMKADIKYLNEFKKDDTVTHIEFIEDRYFDKFVEFYKERYGIV